VTFVPGNHDEQFRDYVGHDFAGVSIEDMVSYELADGRNLLIFHGDQFDAFITKYRWLSVLGGRAYDWLIALNNLVNWFRRRFGLRYWSFSRYVKERTKRATMAINNFEDVVAKYARKRGADGVVCGHIHKAEIKDLDGVLYCNDGDWVESCTALVEHFDGRLEILDWTQERAAELFQDRGISQSASNARSGSESGKRKRRRAGSETSRKLKPTM
jgi:UDP-2,3-diacylglucosamine pyrophosphatase LpxH